MPTAVVEIPRGTVADQQTRAEVLAVLDQLIACVNAGDYLRAFTLYSDEYLRRLIDPKALMTDDVALELGKTFATAEPVETGDMTVLVSVKAVEILEDGSTIVIFEAGFGPDASTESQIDLLVFSQIDGTWKIVDGLTDLSQDDL